MQRYRVDGRLPPPVAELYRSTAKLRAVDALASARSTMPDVSPLGEPAHDLGHWFALAVHLAFGDADVEHFVTGQRGDAVVFGVPLEFRAEALAALEALPGPDWFLAWESGARLPSEAQGAVVTFWESGTSGELELVDTRGHERFDDRSPLTVEVIDGREYLGRTALPIGATFERIVDPVDIVYTWVDGSGPDWVEAFKQTAMAAQRVPCAPFETQCAGPRCNGCADTAAPDCGGVCGSAQVRSA